MYEANVRNANLVSLQKVNVTFVREANRNFRQPGINEEDPKDCFAATFGVRFLLIAILYFSAFVVGD